MCIGVLHRGDRMCSCVTMGILVELGTVCVVILDGVHSSSGLTICKLRHCFLVL